VSASRRLGPHAGQPGNVCRALFRAAAGLAMAAALSGCVSVTSTSEHGGEPAEHRGTKSYIDAQEAELRALLADSGVSVERVRDDIVLKTPGPAVFEPDVADVSGAFRDQLATVAEVLKRYDDTQIEVCGFTDSTGTMIGNMALSLQRAETVARHLETLGVAGHRITAKGLGPLHPVADNATEDGRQLNRRVELTIRPAVRAALSAAASN
jgi:outer membrane protein OmpA-like peptidoglycan-associated protein